MLKLGYLFPFKIILELVNEHYDHWRERHIRAIADQAGRMQAERMWKRENPDDGVGCPSSNPYKQLSSEMREIDGCAQKVEEWNFIRSFLIDSVLKSLLPEEPLESSIASSNSSER